MLEKVIKAVALFSGGLDSILAAKVMKDLGIEVLAFHLTMPFGLNADNVEQQQMICDQIGVPLLVQSRGAEFFDLVKNPPMGYGANMNPCLDCRMATLLKGYQVMQEIGAKFLITGEVVGQRPMSQRKDALFQIEKKAGLDGLVLRPLCAKHLPETLPESKGWVDREKLLDFSGRSRKPQMALAAKLGITDYPSPAGGCELTEPGFSRRLKHLLKMNPDASPDHWTLLSVGRHIKLNPKAKAIVSRNEQENHILEKYSHAADCILEPGNFPGPTAIITGPFSPEEREFVAKMIARYGKARPNGNNLVIYTCKNEKGETFITSPATDDMIASCMIV